MISNATVMTPDCELHDGDVKLDEIDCTVDDFECELDDGERTRVVRHIDV